MLFTKDGAQRPAVLRCADFLFSINLGRKIDEGHRRIYFIIIYADVWITTSGTLCDDMASYAGEALHACKQQTESTEVKPVLIGFANLRHIINHDQIKQAGDISYSDVDTKVCFILST